ncbi:MAG: hypothetical protein EZS28_012059 [Streblomastix strix]|uniref:Uncharacterized protein n=1 Tax=Streblomastix strix TaxID=222440 RepID=A0A5J4WD87_9EUKA|nr:MAG: hypothetical protein EZS28_012059 [Streblomastix strix]
MAVSVSDVNKIHFIEGDTDSAYWAISGNTSDNYKQWFKYVIKDKQFHNENAKYFFPNIEEDLLDEKKIQGLVIERDGTEMIALAPKNYYIKGQYQGTQVITLQVHQSITICFWIWTILTQGNQHTKGKF